MIGITQTILRRSKIRSSLVAFNFSNEFTKKWMSTEIKPYRAAILEEFNEKLVVESIRNRAKLGDGMVNFDTITLE